MELLPHVEIDPPIPARASIIWLHGLGADGYDLADIVPQLHLASELGIRHLLPHAPIRPITFNNNYPMTGWYDILGLEQGASEDEQGIYAAEQTIHDLIAHEENRGIPTDKIILIGFSQGGALALCSALRYPKPLAGVAGLSAYLPIANTLTATLSPANKHIPILLAHGTTDRLVPYAWGEMSHKTLEALKYPVTWKSYPMEHHICTQEIRDIAQWIQSQLGSV